MGCAAPPPTPAAADLRRQPEPWAGSVPRASRGSPLKRTSPVLLRPAPFHLEVRRCDQRSLSLSLTAESLATRTNAPLTEAAALLADLAAAGLLQARAGFVCPCERRLELDEPSTPACSECERVFAPGDEPRPETFFERHEPPTRDVPWVLTLHGMNTTGSWQESLAWHLATTYGHSVPVFVYKYGVVRPGVLVRFRQRQLVRHLIQRFRVIRARALEAGFGGRPDVIAHSFGTWLLAQALLADSSLEVGRVILTGSIVRPDFGWAPLIEAGRVEAVLCHAAGRDVWASVAVYFIPESGPSGCRGFDDRARIHLAFDADFSHSDFFDEARMPDVFEHTWGPFLSVPSQHVSAAFSARALPAPPWRPPPRLLRAGLLRYGALALLLTALGLLGLWLVSGFVCLPACLIGSGCVT